MANYLLNHILQYHLLLLSLVCQYASTLRSMMRFRKLGSMRLESSVLAHLLLSLYHSISTHYQTPGHLLYKIYAYPAVVEYFTKYKKVQVDAMVLFNVRKLILKVQD